ncbi:MAG: hypothetical protein U9R38_01070 [Candidatus Margulisiibacteriota bacterium]|nr:hypothetical protein [Candidatus Margulisiibacteriota bacterium]
MDLVEPLQFLNGIHKNGVRYLLIGRQSVIAYGGPMQTMDYDIYVDKSKKNIDLLLKIAKKYDLYPSLSKEAIKKHFKFKLENDYAIDVFYTKYFSIGEGKKVSFDELYSRRNVIKGETGVEINLPAIDDLIALKKLRSSVKDLEDIKYLKALKKK